MSPPEGDSTQARTSGGGSARVSGKHRTGTDRYRREELPAEDPITERIEAASAVELTPDQSTAYCRTVGGRGRAAGPPAPCVGSTSTFRWLLASLVLLVALAPGRTVDLFAGDDPDSPPPAAETARPTQAPPAEAVQRPTVQEPFRGSPAAGWASGAAGISVPKAGAVGWMSAAEVERALARSRDFLVGSGLDREVLRGARPEKAIAQINPHQKDVQDLLKTAFRTPSEKKDLLLLFSRFQPSRTHLVGDVVKTRGRLTYREGERGALQVTADVTFVYPVTHAHAGGDDEIVRTIVRRELILSWDNPDKVITEPGTFSIVSYKYDMTSGGCGAPTGYFTPPFGPDRRADEAGTEVDPYDRSAPVGQGEPVGDECGRATRS
ncbi:hypothetical protein [Streptomyces sp. NPDC088348]|uniref:hypothetical protein n=1 Tax=Streptomyces sp. NPDC088348 TaxID=3365853 RepID=UPI00382CA411